MSAPLTLHLLRHGEVYNPDKILYGRMPGFHLSETGRGQASAAGRYLAERPLRAIYASPMERAQETAGIIATAHRDALQVTTDPRINETYTPHDGTPHSELEKTLFDIYTGNTPPHEMPQDILARVQAFILEKRARYAGGEIAAVSHRDVAVVVFLHAMGQFRNDVGRGQLSGYGLPDPYPATASISTLTYSSDDPDEIPAFSYTRPY